MTELGGIVHRKVMKPEYMEHWRREGYFFPIRALSAEDAAGYLARMEACEAKHGRIQGNQRHKTHLLYTWADELVRNPVVLDAVEDILGPNILCWTTNLFVKEPHTPDFVSWHQDSTYWGLYPDDGVVTAWIALSEVTVEAGAMKFLPGSHHKEQIPHKDTYDEHNLLSRGQIAVTDVDEGSTVDIVLRAGEVSLHHIRMLHSSGPNNAAHRRVGLAVRYIPPYVRQTRIAEDSAMLVRGVDEYGHFVHEPRPRTDADADAVAAHAAAMARQVATYYQGTDKTEMRA